MGPTRIIPVGQAGQSKMTPFRFIYTVAEEDEVYWRDEEFTGHTTAARSQIPS